MIPLIGLTSNDEERAPLRLAFHSPHPGAYLSEGSLYRYLFWWPVDPLGGAGRPLVVCMLNPSKAGSSEPTDATVRWLIGYAKRWGYDRIIIVNLAALISTYPSELYKHAAPIGSRNHQVLRQVCSGLPVLCAWGNDARRIPGADFSARIVRTNAAQLLTLGLTKRGEPRHPLRVSHATPLVSWP